MSLPQKSVFVDPALVTDPTGEAAKLGAALNIDPATIEQKMRAANRFGYIARFLPDDVAAKVDALHLAGVAFVDEPKRYTPSGSLTQAVVGTVDPDGNGTAGLEKAFTTQLAGTPGKLVFEQTPDGRTIPVGEHDLVPAQKGDDLVLTLDRSMQYEVQQALTDQVKAVGAKGGMAIVSKPDTGEVLAMVNVRADAAGNVAPDGSNAPLTSVYEPGSVMKLVTATGAIEDNKVTPDTVINLPSQLTIADATFTDAEPHGPEPLAVKDIIAQSSNIGTILIGQRLGKDRIYNYMQAFGFGQKTAVDFPGEAAGVVPAPKNWWDTTMGTVPIGQGVSVTPMQMLDAYNVIANGGVYVPPKLVQATVDAGGVRHATPPGDTHRVVSQATSDKLNLILRGVVSQGTGTKGAVPGYTVAGKTGTARKPINGSYTGPDGITHYMSTFVGFAPAEAPAVSVIVVIDDPPGDQIFGGTVAAPVYAKITDFALRQLGVPPPATDPPNGGGPAHPDDQARLAAAANGTADAEDTQAVQIDADGRVHGVPAGLPPVPPAPVPASGTAGVGTVPTPPSTKVSTPGKT
jgi:cell division protein FtsI (penicillin-binding protein 3)